MGTEQVTSYSQSLPSSFFWTLLLFDPACQCRRHRDSVSVPGSGRSPGGGPGNPLQYSCWRIPWTEEPDGLQSLGSQRVGHDRSSLAHTHTLLVPPKLTLDTTEWLNWTELKITLSISFFFWGGGCFFYFILLYNAVLVLPYIDMTPPWVHLIHFFFFLWKCHGTDNSVELTGET